MTVRQAETFLGVEMRAPRPEVTLTQAVETGSQTAAKHAGRRRLPPEVRRSKIVEAAATFFAEVGLEGRTRDLSARMGITQSLLYKYFKSKEELLEAVFEHIYLDRLSPSWPKLLADRKIPLRSRMIVFYTEYTEAIFTYEWMRIFMFSGLAGDNLNRRYLTHVSEVLLSPLLIEIREVANGPIQPEMEDIWSLHGGIVYIGIRKFIYQVPTPDDVSPSIARSIGIFLDYFEPSDD
jgi:AcrR family transcriptional regulator